MRKLLQRLNKNTLLGLAAKLKMPLKGKKLKKIDIVSQLLEHPKIALLEMLQGSSLKIEMYMIHYTIDLSDVDASKCDLSGFDLSDVGYNENTKWPAGFDVSSTAARRIYNFEGKDIRGLDFTGVNLSNTNFYQQDLRGVVLTNAKLCDCNFINANLTETNLQGADLRGAVLFEAKVNPNILNQDIVYDQTTLWPREFFHHVLFYEKWRAYFPDIVFAKAPTKDQIDVLYESANVYDRQIIKNYAQLSPDLAEYWTNKENERVLSRLSLSPTQKQEIGKLSIPLQKKILSTLQPRFLIVIQSGDTDYKLRVDGFATVFSACTEEQVDYMINLAYIDIIENQDLGSLFYYFGHELECFETIAGPKLALLHLEQEVLRAEDLKKTLKNIKDFIFAYFNYNEQWKKLQRYESGSHASFYTVEKVPLRLQNDIPEDNFYTGELDWNAEYGY